MGCYINPPDMSKEEWLRRHGRLWTHEERAVNRVPDEFLPVCLVDNGLFTAAGVAYDDRELRRFLEDETGRPKTWFLAPIEELKKVSPIITYRKDS